jgi:hypothetical protein
MGDFAQLVDRLIEAVSELAEQAPKTIIAGGMLAGERKPDAYGDQALLNAVVDIALQHLPLPIDGFRDACTRSVDCSKRVDVSPDAVTVVTCSRADRYRICLVWLHRGPTSRNPPLDHGSPP